MTADGYSPEPAPAARGPWRAPVAAGPAARDGDRARVEIADQSRADPRRARRRSEPPDGPAALRRLRADDRGAARARRRHRARAGQRRVRRRPRRHAGLAAPRRHRVDCGQAGTVMRFVAAARRLRPRRRRRSTAHESALHRPMGTMINALRDVGVDIDDGGRWALPFTVRGTDTSRRRARDRRQRVEPVRLGPAAGRAPLRRRPAPHPRRRAPAEHAAHRHDDRGPRPPRRPRRAPRARRVDRPGRRRSAAKDVAIEPDLSNAAPFLAAAMIAGGSVSVTGWPAHSTQPGAMLTEILAAHRRHGRPARRCAHRHRRRAAASGASTSTCRPPASSPRRSSRSRRSRTPRARSTASGTSAATRPTASRHSSASSARSAARRTSSTTASASCPRPLHGGRWRAHDDHRMATTGAIIGLAVAGVEVDDIGTTAKTLPQFPELWQRMLRRRRRHPAPCSRRRCAHR